MNNFQKKFLDELSDLFKRFSIQSMLVCDERIAFESNEQVLYVEAFIRKNVDEAYYQNITSNEPIYNIKGKGNDDQDSVR